MSVRQWINYITFIYLLIVAIVQGCQQPLLPIYNATGRRYLTCNSWEPDCPDGTTCQRAAGEWKERLYINPEFALYLCCNREGRLAVNPDTSTVQSIIQHTPQLQDDRATFDHGPQIVPGHPQYPTRTLTNTLHTQQPSGAPQNPPAPNVHLIQSQGPPHTSPGSHQSQGMPSNTPNLHVHLQYPSVSSGSSPPSSAVHPIPSAPSPPLDPVPPRAPSPGYPSISPVLPQPIPPPPDVSSGPAVVASSAPAVVASPSLSFSGPSGVGHTDPVHPVSSLLPPAMSPPSNQRSQTGAMGSIMENGQSIRTPPSFGSGLSSKLAAVPPQPQVIAAGNGNRLVIGPSVVVLIEGEYTRDQKQPAFRYRGTVVLVQDAGLNILVDTGSANSRNKLIADHLGNDNLFPYAQKFFSGSVYKGDEFLPLQQLQDASMRLVQHVEIWKTPGHTLQHNSVLVRNVTSAYVNGTVAITGDLFLNENDFEDNDQWGNIAVDKDLQKELRNVLLCQADYVIPGHGKPFPVTTAMRSLVTCEPRRFSAKRITRKSKRNMRFSL